MGIPEGSLVPLYLPEEDRMSRAIYSDLELEDFYRDHPDFSDLPDELVAETLGYQAWLLQRRLGELWLEILHALGIQLRDPDTRE